MRVQEERMEGKELARMMKERDLIHKGGKVHIVFDGTICRSKTISDTDHPDRGDIIWTRIQITPEYDYADYRKQTLSALPLKKICCFCKNKLEKAGYRQRG